VAPGAWFDSPQLLSDKAHELIADPENEVLISPVIPWEIALKANKHGQPLIKLVTDYISVVRRQGFTAVSIDPLHAIRSALLPFHHRDPFDRLLAAQSLELAAPLVSRDAIFDSYGVERIW